MTTEAKQSLLIEFLDVCNTALLANKNSFPYKPMLALSRKVFGAKNIGLIVYASKPNRPTARFTVRFVDDRIEPVAEGEQNPAHTLKIQQDYMKKVVQNRREYIEHPARLDWDWLKSRLGVEGEEGDMVPVKEAMTPGLHTVSSRDTVRDAAEAMRTLDVGALPVVDGEELIGMLTDRDIAVRAAANGLDPKSTSVADIMTAGIVGCRADTALSGAADLMKDKKIRRLVVLDSGDAPVGLLSLGDLAVYSLRGRLAGESLAEVCERPRKVAF